MKKIIAILLIISFALTLTSCGNKTKLTLENFEEYLNITTICKGDGEHIIKTIDDADGTYIKNADLFSDIVAKTSVEGASENFNYRDVIIKIRVIGTYKYFFEFYNRYIGNIKKDFSLEYEIKLNVSGDGSNASVFEIPEGSEDKHFTINEAIVYDVAIVSISGYVEPA